jgi:hypothetical protein
MTIVDAMTRIGLRLKTVFSIVEELEQVRKGEKS